MRTRKVRKVLTEEEKEKRYGVPIRLRVPVEVRNQIEEEALNLDVSFAKRAETIMLSNFKSKADFSEKLDKQLKEYQLSSQMELEKLKLENAELKKETKKYSDSDRFYFAKFQHNRDLLRNWLLEKKSPTISEMEKSGFDFRYVSPPLQFDKGNCQVTLDHAFQQTGQTISIFKLKTPLS